MRDSSSSAQGASGVSAGGAAVSVSDWWWRSLPQVRAPRQTIGWRNHPILFAQSFVPLQERIFLQEMLYLLVEFQRGQLQQPDGLLQLRGERQVLRQLEL